MNFIANLIKEEDGVTAIEYALIAALIAGAIVVAVTTMGGNISTLFTNLAERVAGKTPTGS